MKKEEVKKIIKTEMNSAMQKKTKKNKTKKSANGTNAVSTVLAPAATGTIMVTNPKREKRFPYDNIEESLGAIVGSTSSFALTNSFSVNPGLVLTFPWLAPQAQSFNMYSFRSLRIHYKNSTSTNNTGIIVIAFNPDPDDGAPTTLTQVENLDIKLRVSSWENAYVDVPAYLLKRRRLIRNSIIAAEYSDYDVGSIFVVASGNNSNTAVVGEIWLEYCLDFFSPMTGVTNVPYGRANAVFTQSSSLPLTSGVAATVPWNSSLSNPYGIVNTAGVIGPGVSAALIVYTQITVSAATLTGPSTLSINKNGTPVIAVPFGPIPPSSTLISANVEGYVVLLPTDVLTVTVTVAGTTITAAPSGSVNSILVLTPA